MDETKDEKDVGTQSVKTIHEEPTPGCYLKARYVMALMMFFGGFNVYATRNSLNVAIVAMVNSTTEENEVNSSGVVCEDKGSAVVNEEFSNGIFNWNSAEQGLLLGCYFYGYVITCIPGGYFAKRFGIRPVLGITMLLSSIITLLTPLIARTSFGLFIAFRIILGILQGVSFPAMLSGWGKWAPPLERSQLVSFSFSGSSFGTCFILPFAGVISEHFGWEAVFYFTGVLSLLWSIVWFAFIHSSPKLHPRISVQEKNYIVDSIGLNKKKNVKLRTPWLAMLRSLPLWVINLSHFSTTWGSYTLMTMLPTYMATILRFNLSMSGFLSSLPYMLQFLFINAGGYVTDVIRSRHLMSTIAVRKLNQTIGTLVPAVFIVLAGYVGCDYKAAVAFFSISMAFHALTVPGCQANSIDIAPKYGGIIFGMSNTVANTPGFLAPQVAGLILLDSNSIVQWQTVFWMSGVIYVVGAVIYLLGASAKEQSWASGQVVSEREMNDILMDSKGDVKE